MRLRPPDIFRGVHMHCRTAGWRGGVMTGKTIRWHGNTTNVLAAAIGCSQGSTERAVRGVAVLTLQQAVVQALHGACMSIPARAMQCLWPCAHHQADDAKLIALSHADAQSREDGVYMGDAFRRLHAAARRRPGNVANVGPTCSHTNASHTVPTAPLQTPGMCPRARVAERGDQSPQVATARVITCTRGWTIPPSRGG